YDCVGGWYGKAPSRRIDFGQGWVQLAVVLPMLLTGYLVAAVLWGQTVDAASGLSRFDSFGGFVGNEWRYWPFPLYIAAASLWLFPASSIRVSGFPDERAKRLAILVLGPVPAVIVLYLLLCAIMLLLHGWAEEPVGGAWLAFVWGPPLVLYVFSIVIV